MMRFRKKSGVIEATQWLSDSPECMDQATGESLVDGVCFGVEGHPYVVTIHGQVTPIVDGDWIIPEPDGLHYYPCKDQIFRATYTECAICPDCGVTKGADQFYGDKKRKNGCSTYCIDCTKARAKRNYEARGGAQYSREQARKWRAANPRRNKSLKLKHAFGITIDEYETILSRQNGACAICLELPKADACLCVDHDHDNGKVRGLLCHSCNKGIGFFRDNPERCVAAARYLKPDIFEATYEPVVPGEVYVEAGEDRLEVPVVLHKGDTLRITRAEDAKVPAEDPQ